MTEGTQQGSGVKGAWRRTTGRASNAWAKLLRWTRLTAAVVLLLVLVAGIAFVIFWVVDITRPEPGPDLGIATTLQCQDCETLPVNGLVDGVALDTNLGTVHPYGVEIPGIGADCHDEAAGVLRELSGSTVRAQPGPRLTDAFDRRVFYLYTEQGMSIDELMVRNGLALARVEDGQHRDLLLRLEREAASADRGCLWN